MTLSPPPLSAVLNAHGLPPLQRTAPPTVPPPAAPRGVRSTAYTLHVVGLVVADLVLQHGLIEPFNVSAYADNAQLWFRDPTAVATFLAWFEQLDRDPAPYITAHEQVGDEHTTPLRGHGSFRGVPAVLWVDTPARLQPGQWAPHVLRTWVETDRRLRAQRPEGWWDR